MAKYFNFSERNSTITNRSTGEINRFRNSSISFNNNFKRSSVISAVGLMIALLIVVNVVRMLSGQVSIDISFTNAIQYASNCPAVPTSWLSNSVSNVNTGIDFVDSIVNALWGGFKGFIFLSLSIVNSLIFILYFVVFLFA